MTEHRRILIDGGPLDVRRDGNDLVAADGRRFDVGSADHLPPTEPSKVLAVPLNYEGEIAIVMGETCKDVAPADAEAYIAGYTIANDYGLHDFRDTDAGSML